MRPLCSSLNSMAGVNTDTSCCGHDKDSFAWVEFTVSIDRVDEFLETMQSVEDKIKNKNYWVDLGFILSEMVMNVPYYGDDQWYKLKLDIDGNNLSPTENELNELSEIIKEEYFNIDNSK